MAMIFVIWILDLSLVHRRIRLSSCFTDPDLTLVCHVILSLFADSRSIDYVDVFEPLHALASKYNLRLIAVQRRDYEGSTLYSQAEHEDLQNGNPKFLDAHTVLFGHLLEYLIKTHNLPEPKTEGAVREGGIVFLAWSMGCAFATTILSDSRLFGQEQYQLLRRYLTKVVFYGKCACNIYLTIIEFHLKCIS